jgi:hypothetical protein
MFEGMASKGLLVLTRATCSAAIALASPQAMAQKARLSDLSDIAFGAISNLSVDVSQAQSVCAFTQSATSGYNVIATGSGSGGAFTLSAGTNQLAYDVQWASASAQSSGISLASGVPLSGLTSAATQQTCNSGPASSASLIVILRAAQLGAATAGSYSGTLSLMIAPE